MPVDVSCIVACHNKEKWLPELLESIAHQTKKPKEVIVVHDDCDNAAQTYCGITTVFQRPNVGVAKIRDIGFRLSTGKIIIFLDGDDVIDPDYIEKSTMVLSKGADVVYSDVLLWYEHGSVDYGKNNVLQEMGKITPKLMLGYNRLIVSCPMKREVYQMVGGFREMPVYEDYDFWMRSMAKGIKLAKFDSLFWYRQIHGTRNRQDIDLRQSIHKKISEHYEIIKGVLKEKQ